MVGIISGENLGLYNGLLGQFGAVGNDEWVGRNGQSDRIYVNTTTGNLVIQRRDEYLTSQGLDQALVRTYNSLGLYDDTNGDNWRLNVYQRLYGLVGTVNTAGSSITKVYGDGTEAVFTYDESRGLYVSTAGDRAHDTLTFDSQSATWMWSDGNPEIEERYNSEGRLVQKSDADGNILSYTYTGDLITEISDASGQVTYFDYSGTNLTQIRTVSQGQEQSRVRYSYDTQNRLSQVTVDLTPQDNLIDDGEVYVTTYTYDGDSKRVASITNTDGTAVSFTYDASGRLQTLNQNGAITTFTYTSAGGTTQTLTANLNPEVMVLPSGPEPIPFYPVQAGMTWEDIALDAYGDIRAATALEEMFESIPLEEGLQLELPDTITYVVNADTAGSGQTDVEDPLGHITSYFFENGLITEVRSPTIDGRRIATLYEYDEMDNLISVTDGNENVTTYTYDGNGRLLTQRDPEGNTIEYHYSSEGLLLNEVAYLTPDPDGDGEDTASDPLVTRYVYDGEHHLRFAISAEGRVEEHRYNGVGQRISSIQYLDGQYAVDALTTSDTVAEAEMLTWLASQNLSRTQRIDYTFDIRGNLSLVTDYAAVDGSGVGVAATANTTRYVYDQAGQLLTRIDPRGEASAEQNDFTTHYIYDGLGRLNSTIDALGRATLTQYDDAGSQVITRLANGLATTRVYDSRGLLVSEQQSSPDAAPLGTTTYQYDSAGRLRMTTDPTGRQTHMLYDELDRQVAVIDATGAVTEYQYDDADRLTQTVGYVELLSEAQLSGLVNPDDTPADISLAAIRPQNSASDRLTANLYDGAGRLIQSIDAEGNVTLNQYDGLSRLTGSETIDANTASTLELDITIVNERRDASQGDQRQDGTEGADTLTGVVGNDTMYGRGGDDILQGEAGNDTLRGDAGNDQLFGGVGNDHLYGGYGEDSIEGGSGNDYLYGDYGDDFLEGGSGSDRLFGGRGDDVYFFEQGFGHDTIDNNLYNYDSNSSRTDIIQFGSSIAADQVTMHRSYDHLILGVQDSGDTITVSNYFRTDATSRYVLDEIRFHDGTVWDIDTVKNQVQIATDSDDTLYAYNQPGTLNGLDGDDILNGGSNDDELIGGLDNDTLHGNDGNDTLRGGAGNDYLYAGSGNDFIEGGHGNDHLSGSRGNDTYYFALGFGQDTIDNNYLNYDANSSRTDVVEFAPEIAVSDIFLSQTGNNLIIDLLVSDDRLTINNYFLSSGTSRYVLDEIRFSDGTAWSYADVTSLLPTMIVPADQSINGDETPNILSGGGGNDVLHGYDENDQLSGNVGTDQLWGEAGDDNLSGGIGNDHLYGGDGADRLEGGSGNDTLNGGTGNDTYYFERGFGRDTITNHDATVGRIDVIEFGADIGSNEILAYRTGTSLVLELRSTGDRITVSSYFRDDATSEYVINEIRFADSTTWDINTVKQLVQENTDGNDNLYAYAQGGTLDGAGGDDYLYGDEGNDTLTGAIGNDYLYGSGGDDHIEGGSGDDRLQGDADRDQLFGGAGNDYLYGGDGDDILSGGSGNDTLIGNDGSDIYRFDRGFGQDSISNSEYDFEGLDVIQFGTGILQEDIRVYRNTNNDLILELFGTDDYVTVTNFFSNDALDNPANNSQYVINRVEFSDGTSWTVDDIKAMVLAPTEFSDKIHGYSGQDNLLSGEGGDDTLYGREQADTLLGGDDNDVLYGRDGDDQLEGGRGNDILQGEAGRDELLGGFGGDSLQGGDGDDTLRGGVGNDTLRGDNDDDILIGDAGDDTLYGGSGSDVYFFERGFGSDTISNSTYAYDAVSSRTDAIEFGTGITAEDIWVRRGSSDNLYLYLSGTNDKIKVSGFFRQDGTAANAVNEIRFADGTVWNVDEVKLRAQGTTEHNDTLYSNSAGGTLHGAGGDDVLYGDSGADALWGDAGNDNLQGDYGNDTLHGGVGNDTLRGGYGDDRLIGDVGDDTLYGGSGSDVYFFERGFGWDTINNSTYSYDSVSSRTDAIEFGTGITTEDIWVRRGTSDDLYLYLSGTNDRVKVTDYFIQDATIAYAVDEIRLLMARYGILTRLS